MHEVAPILEIIRLPVEVFLVILALIVNNKLSKLNARIGVVESKLKIEYPAALLSLLLLVGLAFVMSGCAIDQVRLPENPVAGAIAGAVEGAPGGVPGVVGGALGGLLLGALGWMRQRGKTRRRENIIEVYRKRHGNLTDDEMRRVKMHGFLVDDYEKKLAREGAGR